MNAQSKLVDDNYTLIDGSARFTVKNFAIHICEFKEGVFVEIFKNGEEFGAPLNCVFAFDEEGVK